MRVAAVELEIQNLSMFLSGGGPLAAPRSHDPAPSTPYLSTHYIYLSHLSAVIRRLTSPKQWAILALAIS